MTRLIAAFILVAGLAFTGAAIAVTPGEELTDPKQEQRARDLGAGLRCLVCQNQSIDDSDADLAKDLRRIVRERITAGDSDDQVKQYLVDRYGDYVLLKPPLKTSTYLLWFGPALLLLLAAIGGIFYYRGTAKQTATGRAKLSAAEEARIAALLDKDDKA